MRVSTSEFYSLNLNAMTDLQQKITETNKQIITGKRVGQAGDDPISASTVLRLRQGLSQINFFENNVSFAGSRLAQEEAVLEKVGLSLESIRNLLVQANNDTLSNNDRKGIIAEIQLRITELVDLANSKDGTGEYIFSGFSGNSIPFSFDWQGDVVYNGSSGQRFLQVGSSSQVAISDSGDDVFCAIRNGNTVFTTKPNLANQGSGVINIGTVTTPGTVLDTYYITQFSTLPDGTLQYTVVDGLGATIVPATDFNPDLAIGFAGISFTITGAPVDGDSFIISPSQNQSVFSTVQNAMTAISQINNGVRSSLVGASLTDIDSALEKINITRATIGGRINAIESASEQNMSASVLIQKNLSLIEDMDLSQAISDLQRQMYSLEAAQQIYTKISGISLFNFLK